MEQLTHGFQVSIQKDDKDQPILDAKGNHQFKVNFFVRAPKFRVVVFKGGGGRAWVYKKFLQVIEENGSIDYVKEYGGSSAGALFAALAAMPLKRMEREKIVDELNFHRDILDDSFFSKLYHFIMSPLYLVSKPFEWTSRLLGFLGNQFNKISFGKLIGFPLNFIAGIVNFIAIVTHPLTLAGIYNLFRKGGIYRGEHLQNYIRDSIYRGTITCIERFLNNEENPAKRNKALHALSRLDNLMVIRKKNAKAYQVILKTKNITFEHFHQLSKIRGLGFKDIFLTATRCKDGQLKVFNHETDPTRTVHQAVRMSMSAPLIYQTIHDQGEEYMDGGCADNFPMLYASKRNYRNDFEKTYLRGKDGQDLDILGVRVEYGKDLGLIFLPIKLFQSWWEKLTDRLEKFFYNTICGMDIYEPNDQVQQVIKEKYSQRVLDLYDHDIGFTETDIAKPRGHRILQIEEKRINDFLQAHNLELTHMECFNSLENMPLKMQRKFMHFLMKESIADDDIFTADMSDLPLEELRNNLIYQLRENTKGKAAPNCFYQGSTKNIIQDISPDEKSFETSLRDHYKKEHATKTAEPFWGIVEDTGEGLGFDLEEKGLKVRGFI